MKFRRFYSPTWILPQGYKYCQLHFYYELKHNLLKKAHLIVGENLLDILMYCTTSSMARAASIKLLILITVANNLQIRVGDIKNAYIQAPCGEKVWSKAGSEFRKYERMKILIEKSLYSLCISERQFWLLLSNKLHGIGFKPSQYDTNAWMKPTKTGYDFITTHIDKFIIIAKDSTVYTNEFSKIFSFKSKG